MIMIKTNVPALCMVFSSTQGLLGSLMFRWVREKRARRVFSVLYFFTNKTLPILVTGVCYASCMVGVSI